MRYSIAAIALVALSSALFAPAAEATLYYWDNATGGHPAGGTGWWTTTAGKNVWWNGAGDATWPNLQSPRDCATFSGAAGTVTTAATVYVNAINFETPGYSLVLNGGNLLHMMSFGGSQLAATTFQPKGSNQRLFLDDAANPTTFTGTLNLSTNILNKEGPGTLVLNPAALIGSNAITVFNGGLILNGNFASTSIGGISVNAGTSAQGLLGGTGSYAPAYVDVANRTNTTAYASVLSPGDPAVSGGIGTLSFILTGGSPNVRFECSDAPDNCSIFRVQLASPTSYDKLVVTSGGVNLNNNSKLSRAKLDVQVDPGFSGGFVGTAMKIIDITTLGKHLTGGAFQGSDNLLFTNNLGTGYQFHRVYDNNTSNSIFNDFTLRINEVVTTSAGGAYVVNDAGQNLNGSCVGAYGAFPVAYAWDFDNDGAADSTLANPFVTSGFFSTTYGWAGNTTHTITLKTTDYWGVQSWDTTSLTITNVPEPATCFLLGSGALATVGWLRRRRTR